MELKIRQHNRNRIMELSQKWGTTPQAVIDSLLENSLGFYKYEFAKAGTKWTKKDKEELVKLFRNNADYVVISSVLQRTVTALKSQLRDLGYLRYDTMTNQYYKTGKL